MSFIVNHADITPGQVLENLEHCQNTTVGDKKYQLYCVSNADSDGSCVTLPSRYIPSGEMNCFTVTSQTFLQKIFDDTGNACAINCYYRTSINIPTFDVPTINIPTFANPSYTYSATTVKPPAFTPLIPVDSTSSSSSASRFYSAPSASATGNSNTNGDVLHPSAGINVYPNFAFSLLAILAVMVMALRRAN
jgi:hypothetical protein